MIYHQSAAQWMIKAVLSISLCVPLLAPSRVYAQATIAPISTYTPKEHIRTVDQTFLTFPEWFLVFSPAEYADYLKDQRPSGFPFFGHIGQFWGSYKAVTDETVAQKYEFNPGYHLMVMVIGVSTTVEYAIKSAYECTIGRIAEGFTFVQTPEDKFAAGYAKDYVAFIRNLPWYQYDFMAQLKTLWWAVPKTGEHLFRKWERRFALTTELLAKAAYGKLIGVATGTIYETPLLVTAVVLSTDQPSGGEVLQALVRAKTDEFRDITVLKEFDNNMVLATIPRYENFTKYAKHLASNQLNFIEIAGNQSIFLVSMIGPEKWEPSLTQKVLIEQPILTVPGRKRVVATVSVKDLAQALRTWSTQGVEIEHLFDY